MRYVVTPGLLTLINTDGEEFAVELHHVEYAALAIVGSTITYASNSNTDPNIEICFGPEDIFPDVRRFELLVKEIIHNRLIFITTPFWINRFLGLMNITWTETYSKA